MIKSFKDSIFIYFYVALFENDGSAFQLHLVQQFMFNTHISLSPKRKKKWTKFIWFYILSLFYDV